MKRLFALTLAVMMVMSMATVVSAENTTTLTTEVPNATYTLNIPADQTIDFGALETDIGFASITDSKNFAVGKNVKVTIEFTPFTCEGVSTTIPYTLTVKDSDYSYKTLPLKSGDSVTFTGKADGTVGSRVYLGEYTANQSPPKTYHMYADSCLLKTNSADWGKALAGTYTATITFTAEVVAE